MTPRDYVDLRPKTLDDLTNRIRLHGSYQAVFGTPDGERVLAHIMRVAHVNDTSFVAGDPYNTAFNEGMRYLALSILRFVHRDHMALIRQIEEGAKDE